MLEFHLLGRFAIYRDGVPVELSSRPAQSLLAYLLLNAGVAHRRERLAGLLWPDSTEHNARRNLRQALWQIRRSLGALGDTLLTTDDITVALNAQTVYQLDAAFIGREVAEDTPVDELFRTVAAYGGELLPGFYEEWTGLERTRLQAQFERKMQLLLERLVQTERWREVLHWGEQWLALGHTPEPAYRALMLAHAGLGDTASVADLYRRCVADLDRELGVEPSAQTQALYQRLRTGAPPTPKTRGTIPATDKVSLASAAPPVAGIRRHNLPIALTSFIGREKEMAAIQQLLIRPTALRATAGADGEGTPTVRLLTLTGPGGTGKTRLALQAAQAIVDINNSPPTPQTATNAGAQPIFPDGLWLVELASLADPDLIAQAVAAVLGVREEPNYPLTSALIDYLRGKALLLILDNCEHLVEACAQLVEAILRACPQVKILATGRETLGVTGETVFRVPSLSLPDARHKETLVALTQYEAVRLFVARARAVKVEFTITATNAAAVAQICHQLDGVPLALELAAARVRAMTPEQIAARLDDRFRLLTGGSRTALPRQQTLRALIDWSWDLLTTAEQILLRRLAVFLGGWTLEAAEFVGVDGELTLPLEQTIREVDVVELLTNLIEKSLVLVEEQRGAARYLLLETIRQYAREKLLEAGEAPAVRARHLAFYAHLAAQAEPQLRAAHQLTWLARLETEHDNLRAALKWGTSSADGATALALAGNLARFWYLHGYWKEGREWLRLVLAQASQEPTAQAGLAQVRSKALNGAGWLADEDGSEVALYTESLTLCRQVADRWGEAFALRGLAASRINSTELAHREAYLQESLQIFRALQDEWGMALALFNDGWLALDRNQSARAVVSWQESLALFQHCGDHWGIAVAQNALGYAARLHGNYGQAKMLTKQSLDNFDKLGDRAGIALSFTRLGNLAYRRGDYGEATALLQEGLYIQHERGDQEGIINALALLGLVAGYQGNFEQGSAKLAESLAMARARGRAAEIGNSLSYLAFITYRQGDLASAETLFQESLTFFQAEYDGVEIAFTLYGLGLTALGQGAYAQAQAHLNASLALWQQWGDQRYIAALFDSLGKLAQVQGDCADARTRFRASLQIRQQMVDKQGLIESLECLASIGEDATLAVRMLGAAAALRQAIGAPRPPIEQPEYDQHQQELQSHLGQPAFAAAWAAGSAMAYEQSVTWLAGILAAA